MKKERKVIEVWTRKNGQKIELIYTIIYITLYDLYMLIYIQDRNLYAPIYALIYAHVYINDRIFNYNRNIIIWTNYYKKQLVML